MISKYTYKDLTWIDAGSPKREEIIALIDEYSIPPLVVEEMLKKTLRSKVDVYSNCIYVILHFPTMRQNDGRQDEQEIDFILGKNFLITTHYEMVDALHDFGKVFETNSMLNNNFIGPHAGFLFYHIIKELYSSLMSQLDGITSDLKAIEMNIFEGKEAQMVKKISYVHRKLLDFKQAVRFHHEVLSSFESAGKKFFGEDFSYYLSAITGEYNKIRNVVDGDKEMLVDLRETNDSLLTAKTNRTIKRLTIFSIIIFILTLAFSIVGIYFK
ncbi:MAG: CorA family divalent cation transporter [Candidatus Paceibacterota bacterium]|jgi:magnesium transporter